MQEARNGCKGQDVEEPLDRAVLAPTTVQRVEDDVRSRCQPRKQVDRIAPDVDRVDS